jgi:glycosyltransferase involved in cell wall biosynthesis
VSVGVPTHNGEAFLRGALEALIGQDHENLEILVSDNASTDATPEIVREFIERDGRIRLERSETLITASQNFNRVFLGTSGAYFMWAADDDLRDPTYIRRCLEALEPETSAVMACTGLRFIDPEGTVLDADYDRYDNPDLSSTSVVERVRLLLGRGGWYEIYGLIRRDALTRTHLFQDRYAPDVLLVLELALLGPVLKVADPLFFYRRFPVRTERDRVERQGGIPDTDSVLATRLTHLHESLSATVRASGLAWPMKLRLRAELFRAAYIGTAPLARNTRRELGDRVARARRERDVAAYVKYRSLEVVDAIVGVAPAVRRSVSRARRWAGRQRRRL